ncbi:crotonase/enoyl-CoA hydratase family protein [Nocardia rhizosphaerihabitans]|uniref:Enoyl-CoA hydratase n=1 Tax=Nocardia rhizosphaerihabitans TaxID=1691570 RepID=A0ABQ2KZQ3_9NOCA|nr:crotonase/enoyl-CoA hydratase family protein [Nocardia rhizosphaerihabitans]GGN97908.1 enoyl-CoA hydratase [Nocardia rhizosphaerihabitans]
MCETTSMQSDVVKTEVRGNVLLIGLNRPEKKNALTGEMFQALAEAYERYDRDDNLRCAVLYGEGGVYCAGADMAQLQELVESGALVYGDGDYDPFGTAGVRLSKPLIAAVHGVCFAGGLQLALSGEFTVAAEGTLFGQPEVLRGVFAFFGGAARWVETVGYANAQRYLLTGHHLDAREAYRIGLVQEVVPAEELLDRALQLADEIAAAAPMGVRYSLAVSRRAAEAGVSAAFDLVPRLRAEIVGTDDAAEGVLSFKQRRAGVYTGH